MNALWRPDRTDPPTAAAAFERARRDHRLRYLAQFQEGVLEWVTVNHDRFGGRTSPGGFQAGQVRAVQVVGRKASLLHELYPTGALLRRVRLVNHVLDGSALECHENGRPWVAGGFRRGRPEGTWRHWDRAGRELGSTQLVRGSGVWMEWHASGRPALRGRLVNGRADGLWQAWKEDGHEALRGTFRSGTLQPPCLLEGRPRGTELFEVRAASRIARTVVQQIVSRHNNEVKYCWQVSLGANPLLGGRTVVELAIDAHGRVEASRTVESTLDDGHVERCIAAAHRRWLFPVPYASPARVEVVHHVLCDEPLVRGRLHGLSVCYGLERPQARQVRHGRVLLQLPDTAAVWQVESELREKLPWLAED